VKLKAYVGRSLEELAPQIREELGDDAVILSQRENVKGGLGGFFGTRTIEVLAADRMPESGELPAELAAGNGGSQDAPEEEAPPAFTPAEPPAADSGRLDVRDAGETVSDLVRAALAEASAAAQQPAATGAAAYAAQGRMPTLEAPVSIVEDAVLEPLEVEEFTAAEPEAEVEPEPEPAPRRRSVRRAPDPAPAPEDALGEDAAAVVSELRHAGVEHDLAEELVREVELHVAPFTEPEPIRELVRRRIAAEIRVAAGWPATGRPHTLVLVGPSGAGKTSSALKLASGYTGAGLAVAVVAVGLPGEGGLDALLRENLSGGGEFDVKKVSSISAARAARKALQHHDLVIVDTPGAAAYDADALAHVQKLVKAIGADETHVVLPLSLAEREADAALARLSSAGADRLLVTKLDEARFAGSLLGLARRYDLALSFLGTGRSLEGGLRIADPGDVAGRILPN
jgi:flagellar biosynthesis protein FlhF